MDQLFTLVRVLEGAWEFAQPFNMCFVDPEKAYNHVPQGVPWVVFWTYRVDGLFLQSFNICIFGARAWITLPAVSQALSQSGLVYAKAVLCQRFCS